MPETKNIKNAYVFIDGNNLYHNVKKIIKPSYVDFVKLSEFVCSHFEYKRKLSIYYNSVPSIADGEKLYYEHMKFLDETSKLPNFDVKTRKLQRHPTKDALIEKKEIIDNLDFCDKCQPLVETMCNDCIGNVKKREKGIDVMIAVDMIDFCLIKNECDSCILISGDADFIHALDVIKNSGKDVATAFIPQGYSYELREHHKNLIIGKNLLMEKCLKDYKTI
ncbi:NYN domain protein [uncultured archaeon]|nr:NYN domain protein [uncultured archaeon]